MMRRHRGLTLRLLPWPHPRFDSTSIAPLHSIYIPRSGIFHPIVREDPLDIMWGVVRWTWADFVLCWIDAGACLPDLLGDAVHVSYCVGARAVVADWAWRMLPSNSGMGVAPMVLG